MIKITRRLVAVVLAATSITVFAQEAASIADAFGQPVTPLSAFAALHARPRGSINDASPAGSHADRLSPLAQQQALAGRAPTVESLPQFAYGLPLFVVQLQEMSMVAIDCVANYAHNNT